MALSNYKKIYVLGIIGFLYFIMLSIPVKAKEMKILSLTKEQKNTLAKAKNWKIEVHHDYGKAKKYSGIPIVKDCKRILEGAGWQVMPQDSSSYDVLLEISVKGSPWGASYATGYHYTGAKIEIKASVKIPDKKWAFTFSKSSASQSCPYSISRSYRNPESAPFRSVYYKNRDFFSQLFSIIYLSKGIEPISLAMKDSSLGRIIQAHVHFLAGETKDRHLVIPLLVSIKNMTGNVKEEAVVALGKIGDPKAADALSKALLKDTNRNVRRKSAEALGKIDNKKAIESLIKKLKTEKDKAVQKAISNALFALGTEEKIPLEFRIEILKERKDWKKLDTLLPEQTTETLIEQLKTKDKVIRGMVAKVLMERTGRFELGTNYNAWKNWLKKK